MSKSSSANNRSANALRQIEAQGLAFTDEAFVGEVIQGALANVALFIEAGIDVNEAFDDRSPLVRLASLKRGNCEIAQLLIDNGADVNAVSHNGLSSMRMAVFNDRKDLVQLLIDNGADVNAVSHDGFSCMGMAIFSNQEDLVQLLIENGADVNAVSQDGLSYMRMAILRDRKDLVQLLIENGADVCATDQDGLTAIHCGVMLNSTEIVRLLIESGADVNAKGNVGLTAMQFALSHNRKDLMPLLIENGATTSPQATPEDVMSEKLEITNIVERLELIEEKFGIAISALYASCYYQPYGIPPYQDVKINFDVTSLNGGKLERSFNICASAYNAVGQLLGTNSTYINNDNFIGFAPESISCHLDQVPAKIRLFPSV